LDSGAGEKLERYGKYILRRPDPQALWPKSLAESKWQSAQAFFAREENDANWKTATELPPDWEIKFNDLRFLIKLSAFKHTGLFPEQLSNWTWLEDVIRTKNQEPRTNKINSKNQESKTSNNQQLAISVLNLFAYTGGATLACAQAGAEVCHVDGSKSAITWARQNAEISGLKDKPVRWILDDVITFLQREVKRGHVYDGIIMDPPAFGHGPSKEMWRIEKDFLKLLDLCKQVLAPKPLFFLINGYASGYSALMYKNNLETVMAGMGGEIEYGELTIEQSSNNKLLPCGIFARWNR
jgi:23S rRNA (cytosine1962-C5)-methyltransferase